MLTQHTPWGIPESSGERRRFLTWRGIVSAGWEDPVGDIVRDMQRTHGAILAIGRYGDVDVRFLDQHVG